MRNPYESLFVSVNNFDTSYYFIFKLGAGSKFNSKKIKVYDNFTDAENNIKTYSLIDIKPILDEMLEKFSYVIYGDEIRWWYDVKLQPNYFEKFYKILGNQNKCIIHVFGWKK